MSGYCVSGLHSECPDSYEDTGACSCPCHLVTDPLDEIEESTDGAR